MSTAGSSVVPIWDGTRFTTGGDAQQTNSNTPAAAAATTATAGAPTANPSAIASTGPVGIQSFGATPQVAPTYIDPAQNQSYINQYEQLFGQSLQPGFQQQDQQLQDSSAARGISNSGAAAYLQGNLLGQQDATLASGDAGIVQQGYGYGQQDLQGNQAAANAASYYNANAIGQGETQNFNAYNSYLNSLLGYGAQDQSALQAAYLNSFGPNTGVESSFNSGLAGQDSAFSGVDSAATGGQGAALGGIGSGLGTYLGDKAESG